MNHPAKIIALDIGTSRIKAAAFDETGTMSGLESLRLDRAASPDSQDAEQLASASFRLLRIVSERTGQPDAVALTGNMHALLGADPQGIPTVPAELWSSVAARGESDELNEKYGGALPERFGNRCIPAFTLPKLLRMRRSRPDLYKASRKFLQSKDFVSFRLTGKMVTDPSDASGFFGFDPAARVWDTDFFRDLGLDPDKLPEVLPSASICGHVTDSAAALSGLRAGTPVVTGSGDLASAALGSGVGTACVSLTLGTAGQLLAEGPMGAGRRLSGKLFVFAHADPEKELYLGSVPAGGFSFEWLAKILNIPMETFFRLADSVPLSDKTPLFFPYILGRGAPSMDYTPCGGWLGLDAVHTPADLCRGAVFGTLCPLRECLDLLEELTGRREEIVFQALACREKPVRETAGVLFRRQKAFLPENSEASLLGAAILGFTALSRFPDVPAAVSAMVRKKEEPFSADSAAEHLYRLFRERSGTVRL